MSRHKSIQREQLGSYWYFPDLPGPDLNVEVVPGQHKACQLLGSFSIAEIFSDDPEIQARIFGPETDE